MIAANATLGIALRNISETLTVGNKELNLAVERGICKEEVECSLIVIFNLFVVLI